METRELLSTFNKLLTEQFGPIVRTKYLGGVAGEGCTRVCFENKSVIVKMSSQSRERMFYEKHAGVLRLHGVAIAELYVSGCNANGVHYIVIEDIPHPLPQDQWTRNIRQVEILFALHHATWGDRKPVVEEPFRPEWTDEMTNRVFDWFARHIDADEILTRLKQAQTLWHQVDLEHCCVSADPNPTNWRVRDDGTLVLVDWERFGYGTPAIDLAILMPGLGSPDGELEKWLASSYVELWRMKEGEAPFSEATLTAQIRLAKLWTAVEFVAGASQNPHHYPKNTARYLVEHLPDMLLQVESIEFALR